MRVLASAAAALLAATSLATPAVAQRPLSFAAAVPTAGTLVLPLGSAADLSRVGSSLDAAARGAVQRALASVDFDYARRSTLSLRGIGPYARILIIGTGQDPLATAALQELGAIAARDTATDNGPIALVAPSGAGGGQALADIATGAQLGSYTFRRYKSQDVGSPVQQGRDAPFSIVTADPAAAQNAWSRARALADGVTLARDLITEPANVIYPETFVERVRESFRGLRGVTIQALDVPQMERLGMGAILAVGQGSARPPRMLVVHYRGAGGQPIALAGKGITFDSGGISLKPGSGMWRMKGDMAGAASVVGAVRALAGAGAPVNVVAIAALAENMPGGSATRPGDVVRAMNGKTIEVLNTDAEGRMVLADAVAYAERHFQPAAIVDVATLTGAKVTALGDDYAGLFSRNDALAQQLTAAGESTGELLWRLPLHPSYARTMQSDIADLRNVAEGGGPGAGLGAHFIGAFVTEATPWAHLDIAGNEFGENTALAPTGVSGFGVRLLDQFVRNFRPVAPSPAPRQGTD